MIPPPSPLPTDLSVDAWTARHLSRLYTLLRLHTPMNRPSPRSKPWWSPLLSTLRSSFHRQQRASRTAHSPSSLAETRSLRNAYFEAIKKAKAAHWKDFLSSVNHRTVWTAAWISRGRDPDRFPSLPSATSPLQINDALLSHFFPPKPHTPSASFLRIALGTNPLQPEEISCALSKSSNTSAPGPDQIPYRVWKTINSLNPSILLSLLLPLLALGYHPSPLKRANGIVLPKPGKADYSTPSSFRIIILLETVSKILERIVATRLSTFARTTGLLHTN